MKKLKLNLDALTVESFKPVADRIRSGGTVRGRETGDASQFDCWTNRPGSCAKWCTWDYQSCYATQCAETNEVDCSNDGWCTIQRCGSVGVC